MKYILMIGMLMVSHLGMWGQNSTVSRKITNNAFQRGEFLKYRIHYGLITAGFGTLKVAKNKKKVNGRDCYHIICKGYTSGAFDVLYKVRDTYESYCDEDALYSWRFNRDIQEGKYKRYTETHFNHNTLKAHYYNHKKEETLYDIPPNIQDVISAYYFARVKHDHKDFKPGYRISLKNFVDRKTFGLQAEVIKKETIKVGGVKYKAIRMKMMVEEAGLVTDGSKIVFWISDDANKIPLRVKSDLVIGSLKMDLVEAKNLMHPFDALVSN